MKKFTFLPLLFLCIIVFGQKQIVVQNGTAQSFEDINVAIAAANAGDTIYIPGGGFNITQSTIEKTLHWRGVGHYPDSTVATGHTQIANALWFTGNCDNSTFEGIYFKGGLAYGTVTNKEVTGVKIKHCRVDGTITLRKDANTDNGIPNLNFHLSESVISALDANNGSNCLIEKNLIFSTINEFRQSIFNHNAINVNASGSRVLNYCINCQFLNNVFSYEYGLYYSANCNFQNNLFSGGLPYDPITTAFTGSNNITSAGNMFTTITNSVNVFSYDNDYHLNTTSTGTNEDGTTGATIISTATDGTNAGVYGTTIPYKEGAVPYSPHIRTVDIDNEAINGNLGVKITVAAQEK